MISPATRSGSSHRSTVSEVDLVDEALRGLLPAQLSSPALLHRAMHTAISGGKRQRAKLVLRIGEACRANVALVLPVACSVEFVHAASLVHDDLPCFDGAATRRGRPSCHVEFGVPIAVLAGDALLAKSFEALAALPNPGRLIRLLAAAVGTPHGIIGGQAMEVEPDRDLDRYHAAKTASLYAFAARAASVAAGDEDPGWEYLGNAIGRFAQIVDDLVDVGAEVLARSDKPTGQDQALDRPNVALLHGVDGARAAARLARARVAEAGKRLGGPGERVVEWFDREIAAASRGRAIPD